MPRYYPIPSNKRQAAARSRALKVLRRMRRGMPLSRAAIAEHVKVATVKKYLGTHLKQDLPGKRWKASKSDRLTDRMNVVTPLGTMAVPIHGSAERSRLGRYSAALRRWREGKPDADAELAAFEGQTVADHPLITDVKLLATLEEAGVLDFDELYASLAGGK